MVAELCQGSSYAKGTGPCCKQPWCKQGKGKDDKKVTESSVKDKGTMLNRDARKPLPKDGTTLNRDSPKVPAGTMLNRDKQKIQPKVSAGTQLKRDSQKTKPQETTQLRRDVPKTQQHVETKLNRDKKPEKPTPVKKDDSDSDDEPLPTPKTTMVQAKTTFTQPRDKTMAARQTKIETLSPAERQEQEEWAQEQLQQNSGQCAAGYTWFRIEKGYRCHGGSHMVTDENLAEGKGGYYITAPGLTRHESYYRSLGFENVFVRDYDMWLGPVYDQLPFGRNGPPPRRHGLQQGQSGTKNDPLLSVVQRLGANYPQFHIDEVEEEAMRMGLSEYDVRQSMIQFVRGRIILSVRGSERGWFTLGNTSGGNGGYSNSGPVYGGPRGYHSGGGRY